MVRYKIFETDQFLEDLSEEFGSHSERIRKKLSEYVYPQLRKSAYFGKHIKKLKNYKPETWRYRVGNYRFFYEIDEMEHIVYMVVAEFGKDSYR